ncbi:MAG: hypothetical protein DRH32_01535 [Deltaproteobacteria bacterium]|nr:MAG: hypothetical protein DRH32_01535 [Deltaproteobacteria bacterium]
MPQRNEPCPCKSGIFYLLNK